MRIVLKALTSLLVVGTLIWGVLTAASYVFDRISYPWVEEEPGLYKRIIIREDGTVREFTANNNNRQWITRFSCPDKKSFEQYYVYRDVPVQILAHVPCPPQTIGPRPKMKTWDWLMWQWWFLGVPKT